MNQEIEKEQDKNYQEEAGSQEEEQEQDDYEEEEEEEEPERPDTEQNEARKTPKNGPDQNNQLLFQAEAEERLRKESLRLET